MTHNLTVPYRTIIDMGEATSRAMLNQIRGTVEEETGQPYAWRHDVNRHCLRLEVIVLMMAEEAAL